MSQENSNSAFSWGKFDKLGNTISNANDDDLILQNLLNNSNDINDKNTHNNKASFSLLPIELLILVFSYLDPLTLKSIGYVCKNWYNLSKDNTVWLQVFRSRFNGLDKFSSVSKSTKWKQELIQRELLLKKFTKSQGSHNAFYILSTGLITEIHYDFSTNKIVSFGKNTGNLLISSFNNGKFKELYFYLIPSGTTSYDIGKNCICYGRWDGKVFGNYFVKNNLQERKMYEFIDNKDCYKNFNSLPNTSNNNTLHHGLITSVHVNQTENYSNIINPHSNINLSNLDNTINCFTADNSGLLIGWNILKRHSIIKLKIGNNGIIKINSNFKDYIIVINNIGELFVIYFDFKILKYGLDLIKDPLIKKLTNISIDDLININLIVDYYSDNLVLISEKKIDIFKFKNDLNFGNNKNFKVLNDDIIYKVTNELKNDNLNSNSFNPLIAGNDSFNLAVLFRSGKIMVFNVRDVQYELKPIVSFYPNTDLERNNASRSNDMTHDSTPEDSEYESDTNEENEHINIPNINTDTERDEIQTQQQEQQRQNEPNATTPNPNPTMQQPPPNINNENINDGISPKVCSICINSIVILVGLYNGVVDMYDLYTGKFLRRISNKSRKFHSNTYLFPVSNIIIEDEVGCKNFRGVVVSGNVVQFFKYGELESPNRNYTNKKKKNFINGANSKSRKLESFKNIQYELDDYEIEETNKINNLNKQEKILSKFNGDKLEDSDEELQIALALSASINNSDNGVSTDFIGGSDNITNTHNLGLTGNNNNISNNSINNNEDGNDDEDEDLRLALELSKLEGDQQQFDFHEGSSFINDSTCAEDSTKIQSETNGETNGEIDDELRKVLELSEREYKRQGKKDVNATDLSSLDDLQSKHDGKKQQVEEDYEDEDLRLAIELSKLETKHNANSNKNRNDFSEGSSSANFH
ncbi:hypothetical protein BVG19_g5506 [[Candida] boidinii]|nr:hypothetical protein BVG19_g5506 [[Candida] boidinii]OWB53285.1 hypothetical protein B5S27_g4878 [[Candida] boidinii]